MSGRGVVALVLAFAAACQSAPETEGPQVEARSLLGEALPAPIFSVERYRELARDLEQAQAAWDADPDSEEAAIWLGRRLAYLGRYREAIEVYTDGLGEHPRSYRLLRHRGHRHVTLRELEHAIADLSRAWELAREQPDRVEPDGAPNELGIPRSTDHSNILYHLGLAHFLRGDLEAALEVYREALEASRVNDDMLVATTHWLWLTLTRLGKHEEAAQVLEGIHVDMEILENEGYLACLLLYKGELTPEQVMGEVASDVGFASRGFGVASWHLAEGREDEALELFREIVERGPWMAFGAIAAEAELARRNV